MSCAEIAVNNGLFERAAETGSVEAIAELLAPDVMALPPAGPIVAGRGAVKQLQASAIGEHGMKSFRIRSEKTRWSRRHGKRSRPRAGDLGRARRRGSTGQHQVSCDVEADRRQVVAAPRHLEFDWLSRACREFDDGFANRCGEVQRIVTRRIIRPR